MKIRLASFNPATNTSNVFDHKDLADYTAWVERSYNNGYRSRKVACNPSVPDGYAGHDVEDVVMFLPKAGSDLNMIFTAMVVDD